MARGPQRHSDVPGRENPPNLVENFSVGDTICGSCGRVLSERNLDYRSEWRTFSNDDQGNDDPSRVGDAANPLLKGSQLHTEIAFENGGVKNRDLSRAQAKNNYDKGNKSLQAAFGQISVLCESYQIQKRTADAAKQLFAKIENAKFMKGKQTDAVIASCIFIACRQDGASRSFREIHKLTSVSKKDIGRTFKQIEAFLGKERKQEGELPSMTGVPATGRFAATQATSASELISRACAKLLIPTSISITAEECADKVAALGVAAGRSPLSITGACIYLVASLMGVPKSPKEIGVAVDVSDGTIRTAYKLIHAKIDLIMDPRWLEKGGDMSRLPPA
jgi:transcription initiation factor TFIIB